MDRAPVTSWGHAGARRDPRYHVAHRDRGRFGKRGAFRPDHQPCAVVPGTEAYDRAIACAGRLLAHLHEPSGGRGRCRQCGGYHPRGDWSDVRSALIRRRDLSYERWLLKQRRLLKDLAPRQRAVVRSNRA